jgi:hypothetical protein
LYALNGERVQLPKSQRTLPHAGERFERARRGLRSSRRFAQALTPTPFRLVERLGSPAWCGALLKEAVMPHVLVPTLIRDQLLANGARSAAGENFDPIPLVKLFTPDANATWLLTEIDPERPTIAFGLCDLELGCPEIGSVCLNEIARVRGPMGLPVERDEHYAETRSLSVLAKLARKAGRIK